MGELFGAKWVNQYGTTEESAFETWCRAVGDLSPSQVELGFKRLLRSKPKYLPDAMEFRELCVGISDMGLKEPYDAYVEACMMPSPKDRQKWSHPAVYHAGVATGWHELRTMTEKQIYPRFKRAYEEMIKRVAAGEDLSLPVQEALPAEVHIPASEAKARRSLASMRAMLDG